MTIDDYLDPLTPEETAQAIRDQTGTTPYEVSNGSSFYTDSKYGAPKQGTLFCRVLPGPKVLVDPTAKKSVHGSTPGYIRENQDFEETVSFDGSLAYSMRITTEIPDVLRKAIEWSSDVVEQGERGGGGIIAD